MLLTRLEKNQEAKIVKINADKILRDRFNSFGIIVGESVILKEHSIAKQTIGIEVGSTLIVLRSSEAEKIEITTEEDR